MDLTSSSTNAGKEVCCLFDGAHELGPCDVPYEPTGPAADAILKFAADSDKWIEMMLLSWKIATEKGFDDQLSELMDDGNYTRGKDDPVDPTGEGGIDCDTNAEECEFIQKICFNG